MPTNEMICSEAYFSWTEVKNQTMNGKKRIFLKIPRSQSSIQILNLSFHSVCSLYSFRSVYCTQQTALLYSSFLYFEDVKI